MGNNRSSSVGVCGAVQSMVGSPTVKQDVVKVVHYYAELLTTQPTDRKTLRQHDVCVTSQDTVSNACEHQAGSSNGHCLNAPECREQPYHISSLTTCDFHTIAPKPLVARQHHYPNSANSKRDQQHGRVIPGSTKKPNSNAPKCSDC